MDRIQEFYQAASKAEQVWNKKSGLDRGCELGGHDDGTE